MGTLATARVSAFGKKKIMSNQIKLILAGVAVVVIGIAVAAVISNAKLRSLERDVEAAKQEAKLREEAATASETKAAEYKQKIEYLEAEIADIGRIARKQDEELEKIGVDVGGARRDVERAKRIRAISASADELCGKLAELGYPCD